MPSFHGQIRFGRALSVFITLVVAIVLVSPSASAKGVAVIVVHGPLLDEPIVLADFGENLAFIPDVLPILQPADLDERPFLELTGLLGVRWLEVAADPMRWDELPLDPDRRIDGVTHERIYLGTASSPPVLVLNTHLSRGYQSFRPLGSQAVRVLAKYGLPAHVDDLAGVPAIRSPGQFIPGPSLTAPRSSHTATLLESGEVLIVGGGGTNGRLDSAEVYDPVSNAFRPVGSMRVHRLGHTATRLQDGRVLIVGGSELRGQTLRAHTSIEIYDPARRSFAPAGETLVPREDRTASLLSDGTVLIAGGSDALTPTAEIYDPRSQTSRATGEMTVPRQLHRAATLADARVVLAGGLYPDFDLIEPEFSLEVFDPGTRRFTVLDPSAALAQGGAPLRLSETTRGEASVELRDGSVLFTWRYGGLIADGPGVAPGTRVEASLRDHSGAYSLAGLMGTPRGGHTATLLIDGRVLIAGGYGGDWGSIGRLASSEFFISASPAVALPAAGSGGLAGESGNASEPLLWASLAALAAVTGGAGLRLRKRRR